MHPETIISFVVLQGQNLQTKEKLSMQKKTDALYFTVKFQYVSFGFPAHPCLNWFTLSVSVVVMKNCCNCCNLLARTILRVWDWLIYGVSAAQLGGHVNLYAFVVEFPFQVLYRLTATVAHQIKLEYVLRSKSAIYVEC